MDSKSVRNLLQVMSELSATQKRDFLQFVTGSPKLPIGGKFAYEKGALLGFSLTLCRFQESYPDVHRCSKA